MLDPVLVDSGIATELGVEGRDELTALPQHDHGGGLDIGLAERRVGRRRCRHAVWRQRCQALNLGIGLLERVHCRRPDEDGVEGPGGL